MDAPLFRLCQLWCIMIPVWSQYTRIQNVKGNLGCFFDVGASPDRKTDFTVYDGTNVYVLKKKSNRDTFDFERSANISIGKEVQSVSAGDFNYDGIIDLLAVNGEADPYSITLSEWNENNEITQTELSSVKLNDKTVLLLDVNNDLKIDIFGKNEQNKRGFWISPSYQFQPLSQDYNALIDLDSASFVDLDQNCKADLVYMTSDTNRLKMISGDLLTSPPQILTLEDGTEIDTTDLQSRMFFADINSDGAIDIIIPAINSNKLHLYVQKNKMGFKELCTKKVPGGVVFELHEKEFDSTYKFQANLPIIVADVDMDSKIDVVAVMSADDNSTKVMASSIDKDKKLHQNNDIANLFNDFDNTDDSKTIKDMALYHSGDFPTGYYFMIQTNENKFVFLSYTKLLEGKSFLSVCPLNGINPDKKKYGATMPGVTIKAFFRDRSRNEIFLTAPNQYQSNSNIYLLHFVIFGLDAADSYIEKLVIGYTIDQGADGHFFQQPGVPPNAQIYLFPYPIDEKRKWRLETFLAPYVTPLVLGIIIAVIMSILGGFWMYLEFKDKKSFIDKPTTTQNFF